MAPCTFQTHVRTNLSQSNKQGLNPVLFFSFDIVFSHAFLDPENNKTIIKTFLEQGKWDIFDSAMRRSMFFFLSKRLVIHQKNYDGNFFEEDYIEVLLMRSCLRFLIGFKTRDQRILSNTVKLGYTEPSC